MYNLCGKTTSQPIHATALRSSIHRPSVSRVDHVVLPSASTSKHNGTAHNPVVADARAATRELVCHYRCLSRLVSSSTQLYSGFLEVRRKRVATRFIPVGYLNAKFCIVARKQNGREAIAVSCIVCQHFEGAASECTKAQANCNPVCYPQLCPCVDVYILPCFYGHINV